MPRFSIKTLLALMVAASFIAGCLHAFLSYDPVFSSAPAGWVESRDDWHGTLQDAIPAVDEATGEPFKKLRVYRLHDSGWDAEYCVRIEKNYHTFQQLVSKHASAKVPIDGEVAKGFWACVPSEFLTPRQLGEHDFYATPGYSPNDGSIHDLSLVSIVLDDTENDLLYVWHAWVF